MRIGIDLLLSGYESLLNLEYNAIRDYEMGLRNLSKVGVGMATGQIVLVLCEGQEEVRLGKFSCHPAWHRRCIYGPGVVIITNSPWEGNSKSCVAAEGSGSRNSEMCSATSRLIYKTPWLGCMT